MKRDLRGLARITREIEMPLCFTPKEAAERLRIDTQRADWLISTFQLRSVLFKGRRYITRAELARAVSNGLS